MKNSFLIQYVALQLHTLGRWKPLTSNRELAGHPLAQLDGLKASDLETKRVGRTPPPKES